MQPHMRHIQTPRRSAYCPPSAARKGFGISLPKLPSLPGRQRKDARGHPIPPGGVEPLAPLDLAVPAEVEALWAQAWSTWLDYSIAEPVVLADGAQVHLVGVGHDQPASGHLIANVVRRVQPDAIAIESAPQYLKAYNAMSKALQPLLERLLAPALASAAAGSGAGAARSLLTLDERSEWQRLMLAAAKDASLKPDEEQLRNMFLVGNLPFLEWLVPAHLCRVSKQAAASTSRNGGAAALNEMVLVACGLDPKERAALPGSGPLLGREFDLYLEAVQDVLGEEAYGHMQAWQTVLAGRLEAAGVDPSLAALLPIWEAQACVTPEQQLQVVGSVLQAMGGAGGAGGAAANVGGISVPPRPQEVVGTAWDAAVARRLAEAAQGKGVVRPCRRIVAVIGKVHVLSVRQELEKL